MRRPMVWFTISYISGTLFVHYYNKFLLFIILIIFFFVSSTYKSEIRTKKHVILLILFFICGILSYAIVTESNSQIISYAHENIVMKGKIHKIEKKYDVDIQGEEKTKYYITVNVIAINETVVNNKEKSLIRVDSNYLSTNEDNILACGDIITISGTVELPEGKRNPNCFDYRLYLKSLGIDTIINASELSIDNYEKTFFGKLYLIKEKYLNTLKETAGDRTAGLVRGLLFGEKYDIEENLLKEFQKNGTAHILAVSGLHIGIIYAMFSFMWVGKKRWLYFLFNVAFFSIYIVLASFSPSVIRAVIMVWLHLFSKLVNKRYDMLSAAHFVALIILVKNPYAIFNVGFEMSFLAVLTISLFLPLFKKIYNGVLASSLTVQLGLLPFTMYTFNYVSLATVFINVPIIFLTSILIPLSMVSIISMFISNSCFNVFSDLINLLSNTIIILNKKTSIDNMTVYEVPSPDLWVLVCYYAVIFAFLSESGRLMIIRRQKKRIIGTILIIILLSFTVDRLMVDDFKKADIVFVDVGQGDCIHFRTEDEKNYLIDGGGQFNYSVGEKILKPYLLKNGVGSIEGAFVTHLHTDHYKGVVELCQAGYIKKLYVYEGYHVKEQDIMEETGLNKEDIVYVHSNQTVNLDANATVEILWPQKKSEQMYYQMALDETDENEMCLIIKLVLKNTTTIITGDVDEKCQSKLSELYGNDLKCDILKVAHHGSKYSFSNVFIKSASPDYSVIQVGKNNFGHPASSVVKGYIKQGSEVYRNDLNGAVGFKVKRNSSIEVKTIK